MFSSGAKHRAEYIGSKAGFDKTVAELTAEHQKELAETFCRTGEFVAVIKRCDDGTALRADIYSPGAVKEGSVVFKDDKVENLAEAIKLSAKLQKMCRQNEKAALWAGVLWAFALPADGCCCLKQYCRALCLRPCLQYRQLLYG